MKKSVLKITALVLTFIMGVTLLSSTIFAATVPSDMMYSNKAGVTEENAEVVMSYMLDNTTPQPGDIITLTITLDKLPSNGLGIRSISNRIGYDPEKLEPVGEVDEWGDYVPELIPGPVGTKLGLDSNSAAVINVPTSNYYKCISFGCYNGTVYEPGVVCQFKFIVKDNATIGKADLFILAENAPYAGFDLGGNTVNDKGQIVLQRPSSWYVISNMNELTIE